jgi:hypothetical protein
VSAPTPRAPAASCSGRSLDRSTASLQVESRELPCMNYRSFASSTSAAAGVPDMGVPLHPVGMASKAAAAQSPDPVLVCAVVEQESVGHTLRARYSLPNARPRCTTNARRHFTRPVGLERRRKPGLPSKVVRPRARRRRSQSRRRPPLSVAHQWRRLQMPTKLAAPANRSRLKPGGFDWRTPRASLARPS